MIVVKFFLFFLSHFIPKSSKIWLFGSHIGFEGNSKYLFLQLNSLNEVVGDTQLIWVAKYKMDVGLLRKQGLRAYYKYSIRGFYYSLRSNVYLFTMYPSDIGWAYSGSTILINLWHGIPLKKVEFDNDKKLHNLLIKFHEIVASYTYKNLHIVSPKGIISSILTKSFKIPLENSINYGFPRNFPLTNSNLTYYEDISVEFNDFAKKLLYCPTWRDFASNDFLSLSFPDMNILNIALKNKNYVLIVKLHPFQFKDIKTNFSNIYFIEPRMDIYSLFLKVDLLITDYSSILFDFLLTGKPICFYPFDFENYIVQNRGLYFNYSELLDNIKWDFSELVYYISNCEFILSNKLKNVRTQIWGNEIQDSPEELYAKIVELLPSV